MLPVPSALAPFQPYLALGIVAVMLLAFTRERLPPSVVAVAGAAAFMALGLVPLDEAMGVFSNEAPIAIAALFILSGALVRTGALEAVASRVLSLARTEPRRALASLFGGTFLASAFTNNAPVVIVVTPVMSQLAGQLAASRKRFLIPLSYVTILGGTCTLIGTSTNLLVAGMASARGAAEFGIFSVTGVGLVAAAAGITTLLLLGPRLLPSGEDGDAGDAPDELILTEARVREGSKVAGMQARAASALVPRGVQLVAVVRGAERMSGQAAQDATLQPRDRLVLRATEAELVTLAAHAGLEVGIQHRALSGAPTETVTVTLDASDPGVGVRLRDAPFASRYPVRVLGAARQGHAAGPALPDMVLRPGDRVWIEATPNTLRQLREAPTLFVSGAPAATPFRRERVAVAVGVLLGVVALAATGLVPIAALALVGVALILVTRCLDAQEAWRSVDLDVLVLIFAMLIVGRGLDASGSVALVVDAASPYLAGSGLFVLILGLYAMTSVLTEVVTNNAVAVIVTPLAVSLAASLGVPAEPLLLAVMFAASASFATPIGYQTNTLVYAAGGYRFSDFLRIGVPMNVTVGLATCAAIYLLHGR